LVDAKSADREQLGRWMAAGATESD